MTDEFDLFAKAKILNNESNTALKNALHIKSILEKIDFSIQRRYELSEIVFPKQDEFSKMMENLDMLHMQIKESRPAYLDGPKVSLKLDNVDSLEYVLQMYKNSQKLNKMCKSYLDDVLGTAYWLLKYCQKSQFVLPGGKILVMLAQKEGFFVAGILSTDLRQGENSTYFKKECGDLVRKTLLLISFFWFFRS